MYGKILIRCDLEVRTGMHIGGSSAFSAIGAVDSPVVRDPYTGYPIVPGSSLKGKLRTLLARSTYQDIETSVYKGYKQDKIEMRGDRAEMSDFPLYLNTVAGGLDRRDQTIGGFSFVVKIYAVPVVEIIG